MKDNSISTSAKTSCQGLVRFAEVLDRLNRTHGVVPVPTKKDAEVERRKKGAQK